MMRQGRFWLGLGGALVVAGAGWWVGREIVEWVQFWDLLRLFLGAF